MLNWYHQSWQEVQDMPLEDIQKLIGNISRIDTMYHGDQAASPSGRQMKPGDMGTPAEIAAMARRIEAEQDQPFDPDKEIMIDGKRYNIRK